MLIGCCHCESDSIPPSESIVSESQSESGSNNFLYGICGCVAVPLVWEVIWPAMDANAACPFAAGIYDLSLLPGDCVWEGGPRGYRMEPVAGAWQCTSGVVPGNVPLSRSFFRLTVNDPPGVSAKINLRVQFGTWGPTGLGQQNFLSQSVIYSGPSGFPCIINGAMSTGGTNGVWHNNGDTTFPYTYVNMPLPSAITIRPKL